MKFYPLLQLSVPLGIAFFLASFAADHYFNFWNIFFFLFLAAFFGVGGGIFLEDYKKEKQNEKDLKEIEEKYFKDKKP